MSKRITLGSNTYEFPVEGGFGRGRDVIPWAQDVSDRAGQGTKLAYLNVKDYGAKGDFATDDTAAFQVALTALQNSSTAHVLFIPDGNYLVSSELTLAGVYSKAIIGASRSVLYWRGNDATKYMLKLTNCSTVQVKQLNLWNYSTVSGGVRTEYPCAGGLYLEHAATPATGVGQNYFELLYVQGEDPNGAATPPIAGRQFANGIVCGGLDGNNDHHRFVNCRIQSVAHNAYDSQQSQATDHTFIGCFFLGGDGYGVQNRSTFYWLGGACSCDQTTGKGAFRRTSPSSTPGCTTIVGANCESAPRLLVCGAEFPSTSSSSASEAITLIGCRFSTGLPVTDGLQPVAGGLVTYGGITALTPTADLDGTNGTVGVTVPIYMNWGGPLVMIGCKFEFTGGTPAPRRVAFRVAGTTGTSIFATGNTFHGDNYLVQPFIVGPLGNAFALQSAINVTGNRHHQQYTDTVGGPAYDGTVDHPCADLAVHPAGSLSSNVGPIDRQQTVAYASTLAFDTTLGSTAHVGTLTGNVSTISVNNGRAGGEKFRIILKQDGTGSRTIPTSWTGSNVIFEGGSKTLSTAANAVDMIEMVWDGTLSFWICSLRKNFS